MNDRQLLETIATQLRQWAIESNTGGWSTHQVAPQRRLADTIDEHLAMHVARVSAPNEIAELRKEKARLDALEALLFRGRIARAGHGGRYFIGEFGSDTLRDVIDYATQEALLKISR